MTNDLLIFGGSVRAAAFSAIRAGFQPWCADRYADADLCSVCTAVQVSAEEFPKRFAELSKGSQPGPWMYTGPLENHVNFVSDLAVNRVLWGNRLFSLRYARNPGRIARWLKAAHLPYVPCTFHAPASGRWLVKPVHGAGGRGIRFWNAGEPPPAGEKHYWQEWVDGEPYAAVFHGHDTFTCCLGVTRQLVGEPWLHAPRFAYCGSIGPVDLGAAQPVVVAIGKVLAECCALYGLFGFDFIMSNGKPRTIEVNPRYTASVEVLEYATGIHAIGWHRMAFRSGGPIENVAQAGDRGVVGKAILYAPRNFTFPNDGPWRGPVRVHTLPEFADIPRGGERITAGQPVLTLFARADSVEACIDALQQRAKETTARLWEHSEHVIAPGRASDKIRQS